MPVKADHRIEAPLGEGHQGLAVPAPADMNAFAAEDAPVGMVIQEGMVLDEGRLFEESLQPFGLETDLEEFGDPLQLAPSICGTGTALDFVDGHEEAKGASLKAPYGRGIGLNGQGFRHPDGAGRDRVFPAVYLNEAQAAGGRGKQRLGM